MRLIGGHTVSARAARRQERLASRPGDRDVCRPVHRDRVGVLGCYRHLGLPAAWAERDRDGLLALAGRPRTADWPATTNATPPSPRR